MAKESELILRLNTGGNKISIPAGTLVKTQFRAPFIAD